VFLFRLYYFTLLISKWVNDHSARLHQIRLDSIQLVELMNTWSLHEDTVGLDRKSHLIGDRFESMMRRDHAYDPTQLDPMGEVQAPHDVELHPHWFLECLVSLVAFLCWYMPWGDQYKFLIHSYIWIYLQISIVACLSAFLGTNSLSVLMRRKVINQSINQSPNQPTGELSPVQWRMQEF